ncbi:tripartite motif-containing protein 45-like isoform X2 [Xenia sp. Carnegie-2017]|uniref:tripartite motif-containing protein 45-like isoform X2 n=1 Tax=Xenia sp. Carnegie-2017 TaxID=2897299 RepID=UPI001F037715|nr:tripartite motif-containing protein 45-like isoform X2 [Xenia sp. Carnegie-2017]
MECVAHELTSLLECPICMETLKDPKSLPCFHNFCSHCLQRYIEEVRKRKQIVRIPCPSCRSEFYLRRNGTIQDIPGSFLVKNMLDIAKSQKEVQGCKCQLCDNPGLHHCSECKIFMCEDCKTLHNKFPGQNQHTVLSIDELDTPEGQAKIKRIVYCQKHPGETLRFYCETCKELCCNDCLLLYHMKQNHSCISVQEVAATQLDKLTSITAKMEGNLTEGKKALDCVAATIVSLNENASVAKQNIIQRKDNILKVVSDKLEKKAVELCEEVNLNHDKLLEELMKQQEQIQQYVDNVEAFVSIPRNLLERKNMDEILSSRELIDENIGKLETLKYLSPVNDGNVNFEIPVFDDKNADLLLQAMGVVYGSINQNLAQSQILRGEKVLINQLQQWLHGNWNLLYRASRDGWSAYDFHRLCNDKGGTVFLVKVDDFIFGGFTDQSWNVNIGRSRLVAAQNPLTSRIWMAFIEEWTGNLMFSTKVSRF